MHMHVTSINRPWTQQDLDIGSPEWPIIWSTFPDGADWFLEKDVALNALEKWRHDMCTGAPGHSKPIVDVIAENGNHVFGRFGRHLANDFLYYAANFPGAPCSWVCSDDACFSHFTSRIVSYTQIWQSADFLKRCGMSTNSSNPFAFNTTSDRNYTAGFIWVFRKAFVKIPQDLYNQYLREGLFNPTHKIGDPYQYTGPLSDKQFKRIEVNYHAYLDAFTVITARVPDGWKDGPVQSFSDFKEAGYSTTIRPAQFHEAKQNMVDPDHAIQVCLRPGRPAKVTGNGPGQKRKALTRETLEKMKLQKKRKLMIHSEEQEKENELPIIVASPSPPQRLTHSHKC
ncbi:uncharacterized protein LACBIDRAFT_310678 [Laccaria bicolor S238N-H82]|uniref:Predicted protein n=1 Tax=Laccaria bicolor (strain S238N-H82 / ATCC MYA-4686) TaxID=486041 RepID=B0DUV9_LACBS|nr:uncharacterized protein LACBIDRAFT_310678 [Laccaria bicolor S238N-H82]EDR01612.1 predicted protein [Laccaria bicolor S238N-H82]|eukprot:XP_001887688.1 predicted protein [Laccaria bicolor S238N-H82]